MLKIRLKRVGRKHDPSYRVVLTDSRKAAKKGEKEILGTYDPRRNDSKLNAEKIKEWITKGAQVSDTVHNLLVNLKIIDTKKRDVRPTIKIAEKEQVAEDTPKEEIKTGSSEASDVKKEPAVETGAVFEEINFPKEELKEPVSEEPKPAE